MEVVCIGAGYVGGPTMAVMAKMCPKDRFTVVDVDANRIDAWNSDRLPIYEPGLDEIVTMCRGRNLFFSADVPAAIRKADIVFVSVNTPTKLYGEGAFFASDMKYYEQTARDILAYADSDKIVVEKSTVPVRTAATMSRILCSGKQKHNFVVLSNPEFMAEGTAVQDLCAPDRVLIGGDDTPAAQSAVNRLAGLYSQWVPANRVLKASVWSSELSKLASNAMLAQRVSSVNSLAALCEASGADVTEVSKAVGMDGRIGPRFLEAGIGFGGSCFTKDILNLVYLCRHYGLENEAEYWHQVVKMNARQRERFVSRIVAAMFNTLSGKRVALFGLAFKSDTGDTRDSPAITIAEGLVREQAEVVIHDPKASSAGIPGVSFVQTPYEAAARAHAVLLLTNWKEYVELDYARIFDSMQKPAFLFDGRNLLDHHKLHAMGFNVYPVGKPALEHF